MSQFANFSTHSSLIAITGATGGLGKAFAVECASRGWHLFLTDLQNQPLQQLATSLARLYDVQVFTQTCDLTDMDARTALIEQIRTQGLRFWGLINVAGLDYEGLFYQQSRKQIHTILRLNIESVLDMTHSLFEFRDPHQSFRIINVSSLAAFYPMPIKATYAASKRFLLDFSRALREELQDLGATVTVLCPAGMPTTPEYIQAIAAQGWMGQITTCDVGRVANQTLNAALAGKTLVIPGLLNRYLQKIGSLLPSTWIAAQIHNRWTKAHKKRGLCQKPVTS